jgi:hypothetical protein
MQTKRTVYKSSGNKHTNELNLLTNAPNTVEYIPIKYIYIVIVHIVYTEHNKLWK